MPWLYLSRDWLTWASHDDFSWTHDEERGHKLSVPARRRLVPKRVAGADNLADMFTKVLSQKQLMYLQYVGTHTIYTLSLSLPPRCLALRAVQSSTAKSGFKNFVPVLFS